MENNYEQKYKKALDNARLMYDAGNNDVKHIVGQLFPELKESEDEMVRQKILFLFYSWRNNEQVNIPNKKEVEKAIAWLEKQGQVKESAISQHENRTCEENGNSLTSEEAIEREVKEDAGGYPYIDATELYDYENDKPLAKAGDKVKVLIVKDK